MKTTTFDNSSFLNKLTFSWVNQLVFGQWQDFLEENQRATDLSIDKNYKIFEQNWQEEMKKPQPKLSTALWNTFKKEFILTGIFKLLWSGLMLLSAFYFVRSLLKLTTKKRDQREDSTIAIYTIFFFLSTWLMSIMQEQMLNVGNKVGTKAQSLLSYIIYRKAQKLENITVSTSYVANMILNDCSRVYEAATATHVLWSAPVEALSIVGLLIYQIGLPGFMTLAVISLVVPALYIIGKLITNIKNKNVENTNRRISVLLQTLTSIKLIKFYVWENYFKQNIYAARKQEIQGIQKVGTLQMISLAIVFSAPPVVALCLFSLYVNEEGYLEPTVAFTTLSLFNTLRFPLVVLPKSIKTVSEFIGSITRIQSFLVQPEFHQYTNEYFIINKDVKDSQVIAKFTEVELGYTTREPSEIATWIAQQYNQKNKKLQLTYNTANNGQTKKQLVSVEKEKSAGSVNPTSIPQAPTNPLLKQKTFMEHNLNQNVSVLKIENFEIRRGERVGIMGPVGSGQSTLLQGLMGDVRTLSGQLEIFFDPEKVSYVQQTPWIQSGNIRHNIILDKPFDQDFYSKILELCCLKQDLLLQPQGDLTELYERGTNLSGGQRQRINIARAVYMNSDIYLLDSPLSAVDYTTQQYISNNLFRGFLKDQTIIQVTHQLHMMDEFDQIIILQNQQIVYMGKPEKEIIDREFPNYNKDDTASQVQKPKLEKEKTSDFDDENINELPSNSLQDGEQDGEQKKPNQRIYNQNDLKIKLQDQNVPHAPNQQADPREINIEMMAVAPSSQNNINISDQQNNEVVISAPMKLKRKASNSGMDPSQVNIDLYDEEHQTIVERTMARKQKTVLTNFGSWVVHGSIFLFVVTAFSHVVTQINRIISDNWISWWTADFFKKDSIDFYNIGYLILVIGFIINLLFRGKSFYYYARVASESLHNTAVAYVLNGSLRYFNQTPLGSILEVFSRDVEIVDDLLPDAFHLTFVYCMILMTTVILVSIKLPFFAILVSFVLIVVVILLIKYVAATQKVKQLISETSSLLISSVTETLDGISLLRSSNQMEYCLETVRGFAESHNNFMFIQDQIQLWLAFRLDFFGSLFVLLTSLLVLLQDITPSDSGLAISNCFQALVFLTWACRGMSDIAFSLFGTENLQQFMEIEKDDASLDIPQTYRRPQEQPLKQKKTILNTISWVKKGEIEFNNVFMSYDNKHLCLRGVSFQIEAGERIGVIGRTGAGQSSLMMALFRMFNCKEGVVLIDNVDISKITTEKLRTELSIMPQEAVMFKGTIRSNLDPLNQHSDQEIWDALDKSFMRQSVKNMPLGLSQAVDQMGKNFSLGQKQLICLGRVLLKQSQILILDEATAAMDIETDRQFQTTLRTYFKNVTIMVIAHRIDTIIDSDRLLILTEGQIAEFDTPENLSQNPESVFCEYLSKTGDHAKYLLRQIQENVARQRQEELNNS